MGPDCPPTLSWKAKPEPTPGTDGQLICETETHVQGGVVAEGVVYGQLTVASVARLRPEAEGGP